jgi:hypothetical protein
VAGDRDSRDIAPGERERDRLATAPGDFDWESLDMAPGDRDLDSVEIEPGDLDLDSSAIAPGDFERDNSAINPRPGSVLCDCSQATGLNRSRSSVATRPMPNGGSMATVHSASRMPGFPVADRVSPGAVVLIWSSENPSAFRRRAARAASSADV